jgi:hypothetical protein
VEARIKAAKKAAISDRCALGVKWSNLRVPAAPGGRHGAIRAACGMALLENRRPVEHLSRRP